MPLSKEQIRIAMRDLECDDLYMCFCLFRDYAKKHHEKYLEISFTQTGSGSINLSGHPGCQEWVGWDNLEDAPAKIKEAFEKLEKENEEN